MACEKTPAQLGSHTFACLPAERFLSQKVLVFFTTWDSYISSRIWYPPQFEKYFDRFDPD